MRVVALAGPPSFKPPSRVPAAQAHFRRGTTMFDARDYANAATEYAAAFELDPDAKWLLLDVAIARRKANACPEAIDAYNAFLATTPPDDQADKAREGEAECAKMLVQAARDDESRRAAIEAQHDSAQARADRERRQRTADDEARRAAIRWRTLELGGAAVGTGILSGTLYLLARHEATQTAAASSPGTFASRRSTTLALRDASWITAGVAGALAATTAIYYTVHRDAMSIALALTRSGAILVVTGPL
jgi:tetratricopeptide (TPR) repeat protein